MCRAIFQETLFTTITLSSLSSSIKSTSQWTCVWDGTTSINRELLKLPEQLHKCRRQLWPNITHRISPSLPQQVVQQLATTHLASMQLRWPTFKPTGSFNTNLMVWMLTTKTPTVSGLEELIGWLPTQKLWETSYQKDAISLLMLLRHHTGKQHSMATKPTTEFIHKLEIWSISIWLNSITKALLLMTPMNVCSSSRLNGSMKPPWSNYTNFPTYHMTR